MTAIVRISDLDSRVTRDVLVAFCSPFGEIRSVDIPPNKGFAYVEYYESQDAEDCVDNLDLSDLYGATVRVAIANDRKKL